MAIDLLPRPNQSGRVKINFSGALNNNPDPGGNQITMFQFGHSGTYPSWYH